MPTIHMETIDKKISRLLRIPGVLNRARQNHPRTDQTEKALQKLADSGISVSLNPVYSLCAKIALREMTYEEAYEKALRYKSFHRQSATEILPLFQDYIAKNQFEALPDFKNFRAPFPIGRNSDGKTSIIRVRPTFVTIRQGKLHPVFVLGWIDAPLRDFHKRLVSAIVRRALLTQQDFLGSDAEIVSFPRHKGHKIRYQGGWLVSQFPDLDDLELQKQIQRYNDALDRVIEQLRRAKPN